MTVRLNVARLIDDVGGVAVLTQKTGITRTAPYRWAQAGGISSYNLERIIDAFPHIKIGEYFERDGPTPSGS